MFTDDQCFISAALNIRVNPRSPSLVTTLWWKLIVEMLDSDDEILKDP